MASPFESCPVDIVDEIIRLLDLHHIRNLRLTCKACSSSCHFHAFFKTKHVLLTENGPQTFARGIAAGGLCFLAEKLTLGGIVPRGKTGKQGTGAGGRRCPVQEFTLGSICGSGGPGTQRARSSMNQHCQHAQPVIRHASLKVLEPEGLHRFHSRYYTISLPLSYPIRHLSPVGISTGRILSCHGSPYGRP